MIKKLRFKLIAVSMLSLFLVLAIIIATVNILNYNEIVTQADSTLAILKDNGGTFPKREDRPLDSGEHSPKRISPELPYESRYFSVLLASDGSVISSDTGKIAAIDTQTAVDFAKKVFNSGIFQGFIGDYRYVINLEGENSRIIFLDCGRSLLTFRSFLIVSCGISVLGLLAVFLLIVLFSRSIIRPVIEGYEKQKQFITDAGHEIKTPITIIDADSEVLEIELGNNEWLRDIKLQTKRLSSLTNDLIFLSRLEESAPTLNMIEFPLSDVVSEISQSFQALAKTQNKDFTIDIESMISFFGDENSLRKLVSILLDNALKYSNIGGHISLSLKKQGKNACLLVKNTTASPLPENLNYLFDRFYRLEQSRNSSTGGYGLGMSIAKAIVENHKGKIQATSTDGRTMLIKVILPT